MNRLGFFSTRRRDELTPIIYSSTTSQSEAAGEGFIYISGGFPNSQILLDYILTASGSLDGTESSVNVSSSFIYREAVSIDSLVVTNSGQDTITLDNNGNHIISWAGYLINGLNGYWDIVITSTQATGGAYLSNI